MKHKAILKIVVDIGMTVMLLFLMAYELIGEAAHEWLGIGMFVFFVIHHILNRKWSRSVFKGKYTLFRIWQTILVIGILLTMAGSMYSGVILSKLTIPSINKGKHAFQRPKALLGWRPAMRITMSAAILASKNRIAPCQSMVRIADNIG